MSRAISSASVGAASARVARAQRTRDARETRVNLAGGARVDARGGRARDARERARAGVKVRNEYVARVIAAVGACERAGCARATRMRSRTTSVEG